MKALLMVVLSLTLTACVEKEENETVKINQNSVSEVGSGNSVLFEDALVNVDRDLKEIEVIEGIVASPAVMTNKDGVRREFTCGLSLENGTKISYNLVDNQNLELDINGRILKLNRIHHNNGEENEFGDWNYFEAGKNYSRNWTFIIRDSNVMNIDFACSYKFD